ncbi:MAG: M1 family metallopeptidase, partial [Methanomicrobiaceae archaeon]|nr:M1 family metallopeptidase [Methanomicrobiaceae archaeon]
AQNALFSAIAPGYAYTGTVYREIGMQNSDFGGMENVGNTTISTNRIMPFDQMTDAAFEYMALVKVHEFYHNLNGSEVTGRSPFEIWLNEAVTVHIERQFHAFHFGEPYSRLKTVLTLLSPDGGTLMHDRGAGSMPIEPDGFNDPNELITSVTYVKAPEFVRMIETLMGKERFSAALSRYHSVFRHKNASRADWIACMEEESGQDFSTMADQWLTQTGYPDIEVSGGYSPAQKRHTLRLRQKAGSGPSVWQFPFVVALVDAQGRDIAERCLRVADREVEAVFEGVPEPAYLSLNRGYSAYGKVHHDATERELQLQVRTDPDLINRYLAFYRLLDREKLRLLRDAAAEVRDGITDLLVSLLEDDALMTQAGGQFLTIFESVEDPLFAHHYGALYGARQKILAAAAGRHRDRLLAVYRRYSGEGPVRDLAGRIRAIRKRQVKNAALGILAASDTPDLHELLRRQYHEAENAQDRIIAFTHVLRSSAPERRAILDHFGAESRAHPVAWETFLSAVAQNSSTDTVAILRSIERSPAFRIEQANDQRALFVRFAQNKKISLETEEGREYLGEILGRLAQVNEFSTVNALSVLGYIDKMEQEHQVPLVGLLVRLIRSLDAARTPSVSNTARRLLGGAPRAVKRYEEERGESLADLLPA